jgi:ATP-dependent helicase/nuclease subunit A
VTEGRSPRAVPGRRTPKTVQPSLFDSRQMGQADDRPSSAEDRPPPQAEDRLPRAEGDPPNPLADHAERRRALEDLDTTFLVEAAAGSGKTTLLLGRIVNLVRSGRARLAEIAAVTFTEKAAADLRIRLRGELERAGLSDALRELEIARIGTIHAFAAALLRERPVEAGVDPGFTVADPLTARLHLDRAWEAWLPEALSDPAAAGPVRDAIEAGLSLDRLRELAIALVEQRDRLDGLPGAAEFPESPAVMNAGVRATIRRLAELARGAARDPEDRAARALRDLAAWDHQTAGLPDADQLRGLLAAGRLPDKPERLGNKAKWRGAGALEECRQGLAALRARVGLARAVSRHNLLASLARWAAGFVDAYALAKARAGCLDFTDLLLRARDLVRDRPDVRRDFQRGIRYLLVDEFQDTDPLQLEIVLWLADGAPAGGLFVVGDPKQSIYRFRRADIEIYEAAKGTIAARGEVLSVRANFRSTAAILDAVNAVFQDVMVPPPDGAYQPAYVPLEASPGTEPGVSPVVLAPPPDLPPATSAGEAWAQEARLVAAYLSREVERARRFRYGDVALLFRAMTGVVAYEDAFRAAGIPFRTVGGRHYYDRSEVGWTIAALVAIEDPHDPVALVGALRSPFFGVTDGALLGLHASGGELCYLRPLPQGADPRLSAAWALLGALHRERNAVSPAALVERLLVGTQVLAAYGLEPQGEARVANLLKVLDTARALEATGALTFRGFVRWLRDRGAARYEEEESAIDAEDAVRLMTIHKAKGLEFPVVVVPDLGRDLAWRGPVVLADRTSGRLAVNLGRLGDTELTTLDWTNAESREIQRLDAEVLRLLYVALTRAERDLVLPVPARPEGKGFYQHLAALLGAPTDVLTIADLELQGRDLGTPPPTGLTPLAAGPHETFEVWRGRRRELLRQAGAVGDRDQPPGDAPEVGDRGRAARQRVAAAVLARAAILGVDLGRPGEAPAVVLALGSARGARSEVIAEATRLLRRVLADPVIGRARHASWLARDVPVAAMVDGVVVEDRLDLVFEEPEGLVVVRVDAGGDAASPGIPSEMLAPALGRPVREALVLSLVRI